ncbi:MAG TPA: Rrf2 family transcriptional regulator [Spirochaetia bacterium]|nr:Rrf2 family transcriptional regulator [Spirochaetia bacterium]
MRVTTKGRYAVRAVVKLTMTDQSKPVSIRQLAEAEEISPEFLEQIFFRLRKADVIKSTRGPGGGFLLNRDPAKISIKDIFDAVGEEISLSPCTTDDDPDFVCSRESRCNAHSMWVDAAEYVKSYFSSITIQKILDDMKNGAPIPV